MRSSQYDATFPAPSYPPPKVPAHKLILGTPWYGYSYPCVNRVPDDADVCSIKLVPFRGVNCSDAAGTEVTRVTNVTHVTHLTQVTQVTH